MELTNEQRAELLRLAAKRNLKGYSALIQEAVDAYLAHQAGNERAVQTALSLEGTFAGEAGEKFEDRIRSIRRNWR